MIFTYSLRTDTENFHNITENVLHALYESGIENGVCTVFCPHTTAGITINENADPAVVRDMLIGLQYSFPPRPEFRHSEGNSPAHLKASCIGSSVQVIVSDACLQLGTWQGIYFCEFDGPRDRRFIVSVQESI